MKRVRSLPMQGRVFGVGVGGNCQTAGRRYRCDRNSEKKRTKLHHVSQSPYRSYYPNNQIFSQQTGTCISSTYFPRGMIGLPIEEYVL